MPMSKRSFSRHAAAIAAAACGTAAIACVSPEQDYKDYVARASVAQVPGVVDAGSVEAAPTFAPDASFVDPGYVMACVTMVSASPILFAADLKFTASASGGTLDATITPLPVGAQNVNQKISGNTIGPVTGINVSANGVCAITQSSVVIPAAANPLSGEADLSNVKITTLLDQTASGVSICGQLSAELTKPTPLTLVCGQNPCIVKPAPGGVVPTFSPSDFVCPVKC